MFYKNPTKRVGINGALLEGYPVQNKDSKLEVGSISGGFLIHNPEDKNSAFYIIKGLGEVLIKGVETAEVQGGELFELKPNSSFKLDGQLKYVHVSNSAKTTIETITNEISFDTDKSYLIYVLDGVGTLIADGKKDVIRENYLVELNGDAVTSLKATNLKCLITELV